MEFPYRPELVDEAGRYFDEVVGKIQAADFRIVRVPERKVCKECDLRSLCAAEGIFEAFRRGSRWPSSRKRSKPDGSRRLVRQADRDHRTELVWPGKYDENGKRREVERVSLPFQVIERVNESRATREARESGDPRSSTSGRATKARPSRRAGGTSSSGATTCSSCPACSSSSPGRST